MTTSAHNSRRVWGGASLARNVEPGYQPRVSMYQLLHPEMYPKDKQRQRPPSAEVRQGMIMAYLNANGPATASAMEAEFNLKIDAIGGLLRKGIPGIVTLRKEKSQDTGRMCTFWGIEGVHTEDEE